MHWSRNLRDDSEDPIIAEKIDCQDWRSKWEGYFNLRQREALDRIEEYLGQVEWTWSSREIVSLSIKLEREDKLIKGNGEGTQELSILS